MNNAIDAYLLLRRRAGFTLSNDAYRLRSYARFAAERGEDHIRSHTAIAWAGRARSLAQRDARLRSVCRFAAFVCLEDPAHERPPERHFAHHKSRRVPHIYSDVELDRLLNAARALGPPGALRPYTYSTLIALLAATGLRIGEALRLRLAELTSAGLTVRQTKFRKSRLVPLHASTATGLARYLRRRGPVSNSDCIFINDNGEPLTYPAVHGTFVKILRAADLGPTASTRRPRLHDLRHRFAVRSLQACPSDRGGVSQHMLALSTYLGHANVYSTYWYLEASAELLEGIAEAGEAFYQEATS